MSEERKKTLKKVGILALVLLLFVTSAVALFAVGRNNDEPDPTEPSINLNVPDDTKPTDPKPTDPTGPDNTEPSTTPTVPDETQPTEPQPTEPEPTEPEPTKPVEPQKTVVCIPYLRPTTFVYNGKEQAPTLEKHYKHVIVTSDSELSATDVGT